MMVKLRDRIRSMVMVKGYMSVNSPEFFFPVKLGLWFSDVVSSVYKQ